MEIITKGILTKQLKDRYGYLLESSKEFLTDLVDLIQWNLEQGNVISLRNLGTFDIKPRKARSTLHPITGEPIVVDRLFTAKFTASQELKDRISDWGSKVSEEEKDIIFQYDTVSKYIRKELKGQSNDCEEDCEEGEG